MRGSVAKPWLFVCASVYAAATACSSKSPDLPPVEATGTAAPICQVGDPCSGAGSYCIAIAGQGCKYLQCVNASWHCPPDGGVMREGGTGDAAQDAPSE